MASIMDKSAALLMPIMGTKEVDSWSTLSTRLAKLTREEDIFREKVMVVYTLTV